MEIIPPPGYVSLSDARDILMRRMHTGVTPSEDIQALRKDRLHVVDAAQATAASQDLRAGSKAMVAGQRPKKMDLRGSLLLDTSTMTTVNWVEGCCYGMGVRVSNTGQKLTGTRRRGGKLQNGRGVPKRECGYERHVLVRHA